MKFWGQSPKQVYTSTCAHMAAAATRSESTIPMAPEILNQYRPDTFGAPGETVEELLDMHGMTQVELAERTGLSKKTINEIVKGIAPVSPETAIGFDRVFGVPAAFWNNYEKLYRESQARQTSRQALAAHVDVLKRFPVAAMLAAGYPLARTSDKVLKLESLLAFFGVASPVELESWTSEARPAFRRSAAFASDPMATAAWLRRGELQAREVEAAPYDAARFATALAGFRAFTGTPLAGFWRPLVETCAAAGVAVVMTPPLPKTRVCGAARWLRPTKALIQMTLRHGTADHFWFSFYHEACHILKHPKLLSYIDEPCGDASAVGAAEATTGAGPDTSRQEAEANAFSRDTLIPRTDWSRYAAGKRLFDKAAVAAFAESVGVAPGIVVARAQRERLIPRTHCNDLKLKLEWPAAESVSHPQAAGRE